MPACQNWNFYAYCFSGQRWAIWLKTESGRSPEQSRACSKGLSLKWLENQVETPILPPSEQVLEHGFFSTSVKCSTLVSLSCSFPGPVNTELMNVGQSSFNSRDYWAWKQEAFGGSLAWHLVYFPQGAVYPSPYCVSEGVERCICISGFLSQYLSRRLLTPLKWVSF